MSAPELSEDVVRVVARLDEIAAKAADPDAFADCPVCGHDTWSIGPQLVPLAAMSLAVLVCERCAFVRMHKAR